MVTGMFFNSEYNLLDSIRYGLGVARFQETLMQQQSQASITQSIKKVNVPIWFIMGRYDHMTSTAAAQDYFNSIEAPHKEFIVYEQSAHYPQLEETDVFSNWMHDTFKE